MVLQCLLFNLECLLEGMNKCDIWDTFSENLASFAPSCHSQIDLWICAANNPKANRFWGVEIRLPDLDRLPNIDKSVWHFKSSMLGGTPAEVITYLTFFFSWNGQVRHTVQYSAKKIAGQLESGLQRSNGQLLCLSRLLKLVQILKLWIIFASTYSEVPNFWGLVYLHIISVPSNF